MPQRLIAVCAAMLAGAGAGGLGGADAADAAPMRLSVLGLVALLKLLGTPAKLGKDPTTGLARTDMKALYLCLVGFGAALPAVTKWTERRCSRCTCR